MDRKFKFFFRRNGLDLPSQPYIVESTWSQFLLEPGDGEYELRTEPGNKTL